MNGLKENLVEKGQEAIAHPTTAKIVSTYTVGIGSALSFDVIQGWLGIISASIGIVIGIFVLKAKYEEAKIKKLERLEKERQAMQELKIGACKHGD